MHPRADLETLEEKNLFCPSREWNSGPTLSHLLTRPTTPLEIQRSNDTFSGWEYRLRTKNKVKISSKTPEKRPPRVTEKIITTQVGDFVLCVAARNGSMTSEDNGNSFVAIRPRLQQRTPISSPRNRPCNARPEQMSFPATGLLISLCMYVCMYVCI